MIEIDASAGGQVMRTALSLAALLQKPLTLTNIRSQRPNPGLQTQHLASLNTIASICDAELQGANLNSKKVVFSPKKIKKSNLSVNISTAGSTMLVLQTILLPSIVENIRLRITGGTDAKFAPPANYFKELLFPQLKNMNAKFDLHLAHHGYFPRGNGLVNFSSPKTKLPLKPIKLAELGNLDYIKIFSHSASLPPHVVREQANSAKLKLQPLDVEILIDEKFIEKANTIGSAIDVFAHFSSGAIIGANALGKKGKPAEHVGKEAAEKLLNELSPKKPVDSHAADQLLPFMALAKGFSEIHSTKLTDHALNNISTIEQFLDVKFEVKGEKQKPVEISVEGASFLNL